MCENINQLYLLNLFLFVHISVWVISYSLFLCHSSFWPEFCFAVKISLAIAKCQLMLCQRVGVKINLIDRIKGIVPVSSSMFQNEKKWFTCWGLFSLISVILQKQTESLPVWKRIASTKNCINLCDVHLWSWHYLPLDLWLNY